MNYYFNKNTNKIYSFEEEVEFSRFPQFEPLTPEQAAWYEAHPGAKAHEVKRLMTDEEFRQKVAQDAYNARVANLPSEKTRLCRQVMDEGGQRLAELVPQSRLTEAQIALAGGSTEKMYTDLIAYYLRVKEAVRREVARVHHLIMAATTPEEADAAIAANRLQEIKTGHEDFEQNAE